MSAPTRVRHQVLWLTVAVYMITYMDRVVIASAVPSIQEEFGFSNQTMSWILGAFRWGYSLFQIPGAWLGDLIGPRKALTAIVIWWSFFTSLTAFAWNAVSMGVIRFLFGVGEAGAFPIATRSLSRWMLPEERGYAQGLTHAGSRLGAAVTPPIVGGLILAFGWRAPFLVFGLLGVAWAVWWFYWYRDTPQEHASVSADERKSIEASLGPRKAKSSSVPWARILGTPTVWALALMYFCYGWALAIYLDWFPKYLNEARGLKLITMTFYASLPLFAATAGDFFGGWFSDRLVIRTGNLGFARRSVAIAGFLIAAAGIVPATLATSAELCVVLTCVAVFGLEATVGVSWAIPLDIGRDYAGSVSAVMNTFGNVGGAISTTILGYLVAWKSWETPFYIAAALCAVAAVLFSRIDPSKEISYSQEPQLENQSR
jgi:MFS family permease